MSPYPMTSVFIRGKFGHRHKENVSRSRHGSDVINKPRNTKDCRELWELGERNGTDSLPAPPEGSNPADDLISGF